MLKPNFSVRQCGATLSELLVVLAVVGVLAAIATPNIVAWSARSKLASFSQDLAAHLHLARSESIKRGGRVALCKSPDGERCVTAGGWEQGWIVFFDTNNDGLRAAGEPIVQRMGPLPQGWRLAGNSSVSRYISYDASGGTRLVSGGFQAGTLTLCQTSASPGEARQIVLNAAGRPRIQKTTVNVCV